jgi:predicted NACHT family NTPase
MGERSLRASQKGIQLADKALINNRWTQKDLTGSESGCYSRQTISKFFTGKPVDRKIFVGICKKLGMNWQEIADLPKDTELAEQNQNTSLDIDALVQEARKKIKPRIQERCGLMRVLGMPEPIGLNDIYTKVNILEKIPGRRRKDIAKFRQEYKSEDLERFGLGRTREEGVPGLEAVERYSKLVILGKPGAGKTTFLKYLALQCIEGRFKADCVPIFVTLRHFAEAPGKPGLLDYISQQYFGLRYEQNLDGNFLHKVIENGKALVLLDGLDEVKKEDTKHVLRQITNISNIYSDCNTNFNNFVVTCRIAALDYIFENFTEVEVSDFEHEQISTFATNWFQGKEVKSESFIKRLEDNNRVKQLATNPLLLTLLCLTFEESGDLPVNRSDLYSEGLDALLRKWDATRGIYRDSVYKKLSVPRKEDLLSKIALTTFEKGEYFFKKRDAIHYINDYIRHLPDANTDEEILQGDSEEVLKSIEAHHGLLVERAKDIYSFSHLTFHEYFSAREFVKRQHSSEEALQSLVSHISDKDKRWREVFFLAVEMSRSADRLLQLMKNEVDRLVADDEKLQQLLICCHQKSLSLSARVRYKPAAVRAFYLDRAIELHLAHNDLVVKNSLADDLNQDLILVRILTMFVIRPSNRTADYLVFGLDLAIDPRLDGDIILAVKRDSVPDRTVAFEDAGDLNPTNVFESAFVLAHEPELKHSLQQLKEQLPNLDNERGNLGEWGQTNGQAGVNELRKVMIKHRNIGQDWQFSEQQWELLKQYYNANKLLVDCLNSDCYVSREVRSQIEDTLLLPIAEIEKRKHRQ